MQALTLDHLSAGLDEIRRSPADDGVVEMIVRRPAEDERDVLAEALLSIEDGLVGDTWRTRGSSKTPDGSADPQAQVTLMNSRAAALIAGERDRWALAGDQLYVDLNLSAQNLPPGTRLAIGSAIIEVSAKPHRGCSKFSARFGVDALKFVNTEPGTSMNLRGVNCRVIQPGVVSAGDRIKKV